MVKRSGQKYSGPFESSTDKEARAAVVAAKNTQDYLLNYVGDIINYVANGEWENLPKEAQHHCQMAVEEYQKTNFDGVITHLNAAIGMAFLSRAIGSAEFEHWHHTGYTTVGAKTLADPKEALRMYRTVDWRYWQNSGFATVDRHSATHVIASPNAKKTLCGVEVPNEGRETKTQRINKVSVEENGYISCAKCEAAAKKLGFVPFSHFLRAMYYTPGSLEVQQPLVSPKNYTETLSIEWQTKRIQELKAQGVDPEEAGQQAADEGRAIANQRFEDANRAGK